MSYQYYVLFFLDEGKLNVQAMRAIVAPTQADQTLAILTVDNLALSGMEPLLLLLIRRKGTAGSQELQLENQVADRLKSAFKQGAKNPSHNQEPFAAFLSLGGEVSFQGDGSLELALKELMRNAWLCGRRFAQNHRDFDIQSL